MVRCSWMRWSLAVTLASCGSPRPARVSSQATSGPDPWAESRTIPPADAAITPRAITSDAAPIAAAPPPPPRPAPIQCPPAATHGAGGPVGGATPLAVWRSRAELPACIANLVPADIDFSREMLAGALPPYVVDVEIKQPAKPPRRRKSSVFIDEQEPPSTCPPCRGVADPEALDHPVAKPATVLWRIPMVQDVTIFHVLHASPLVGGPCPPPVCA